MCANKYKLDNYVMLFDNNGLQLDGTTDEIMPGLDMSKKAADFGFDVYRHRRPRHGPDPGRPSTR